jgi:exosortase C (VPDSG-CTERM-specific)
MLNSLTRSSARVTSSLPGAVAFVVFALLLTLAFLKPGISLVRFAEDSELHSYILLIPFITAYLVWLRRKDLPQLVKASPGWAVATLGLGLLGLGGYWLAIHSGGLSAECDRLTVLTAAFLVILLSGAFWFWGAAVLRAIAFPVAVLFLMVPMPTVLTEWIKTFFQYTSAEAAYALLKLSGTPVFREGLIFRLPGIMPIEVANECSGIRSSLVLLITSLLAGYLFLRSGWKRAVLVVFVVPLAIARNGFRIFTISMLCVHVDPSMIDSPIHRRGGPLFFLLSLVPFFLFLLWLRRSERTTRDSTLKPPSS